jgi:hypothetical protein
MMVIQKRPVGFGGAVGRSRLCAGSRAFGV